MFETLKEAMAAALSAAIVWVADTGHGLTSLLFDALTLAGVPDSYITPILSYTAQINYIMPLFEVIGMATATFNVLSTVWTIKKVLRYLPFTG